MKEYYIVKNGKRVGPLKVEDLTLLRLNRSTLVWSEGMKDWTPISKVEDLKHLLKDIPPPVPGAKVVNTDSIKTLHSRLLYSQMRKVFVYAGCTLFLLCCISGVMSLVGGTVEYPIYLSYEEQKYPFKAFLKGFLSSMIYVGIGLSVVVGFLGVYKYERVNTIRDRWVLEKKISSAEAQPILVEKDIVVLFILLVLVCIGLGLIVQNGRIHEL